MMPSFFVGQDPRDARTRTEQLAVLGLEITTTGTVTFASTQFANELTDALRRQAAAGPYAVMTAPGDLARMHLIDLKLMHNCPDERTACMQKIGRELHADHLLFGNVTPLTSRGTAGHQASLRLLDVNNGQSTSWTGFVPSSESSGWPLAVRARRGYEQLIANSRSTQAPPAVADRVLVDATNQAFWQLTKHKPGQKLDMSDQKDREMSQTWLDIYGQVKGHRDRATSAALRTHNERGAPYVLVVEQRDRTLHPQTFERRANLDVQYAWLIDQPAYYTYAALFDFTQKGDAPITDQFSISRQPQIATSGWYAW